MPAVQLDILSAIQARDKGIQKATDHANSVSPDWSVRAFEMFKEWIKGWPVGFSFMIEDFRQICQIKGLPEPPSNRAFGGLAVKARNAGLIKSAGLGHVANKKAHKCFATRWQKV